MSESKVEKHNNAFSQGIGELIIHWANVESNFMAVLHVLLSGPYSNAQIIWFTRKNTRDRLDFTLRLAQTLISDKKLLKKFEKIVEHFINLTSLRNHYCHSEYTVGSDNKLLEANTFDTPYDKDGPPFIEKKKKLNHLALNEIEITKKALGKLNDGLYDFIDDLQEYTGEQLLTRP